MSSRNAIGSLVTMIGLLLIAGCGSNSDLVTHKVFGSANTDCGVNAYGHPFTVEKATNYTAKSLVEPVAATIQVKKGPPDYQAKTVTLPPRSIRFLVFTDTATTATRSEVTCNNGDAVSHESSL